MPVDPQLLDILVCPRDRGPLRYVADSPTGDGDVLYNDRLRLIYRIDDGIPVLLVDEARTATDDDHAALTASAGGSD